MEERDKIEDLTGYLPIKEAADKLGISTRRLYGHIEKGRIKAVRFANVLGVPVEELENFEYGVSGRPRQNTPAWRISGTKDKYISLSIFVLLRNDRESKFEKKLAAIRKNALHIFPGTAARYVSRSEQRPNEIHIQLIWRGSMIPAPEAREAALEELRRELADVLDWETARYETEQVLMHT